MKEAVFMKKIISICMVLLLSLVNTQLIFADEAPLTRGSLSQKIVDILEVKVDVSDVENQFADITKNDACYGAAVWMYQHGYMGLYDDGCFKPNSKLTNAMVAKVLTNMVFGSFSVPNFEEISSEYNNHWASIYLWKATDSGLMIGIGTHNTEADAMESNINFELLKTLMNVSSNKKFTRGSFCQKIASTLQSRNPIIDASAIDNPFGDLDGDEDYYEAVLWMTSMGYIRGFEDGTFQPERTLTCGEVAHWLVEMLFEGVAIPDNVELGNEWYARYAWKVTETGIMPNVDNWDADACENDIDYNVFKAYVEYDEIHIINDGVKTEFTDSLGHPFLKNGCVMAPIRYIAETMDAVASWDNVRKTMILSNDEYSIELQFDSYVMYVNGNIVNLEEAPCSVAAGPTYVPVRAIVEAFGAQVYWYEQINTMVVKNRRNNNDDNVEEHIEYRINSVTLKDMSGNSLQSIPTGTFLATVSFTNVNSSTDAVIILAQYTDAGAFKGLMYIQTEDVPTGSTIKLSIPVDNSNGDVAKLKAFCWESFGSVKPMGNSVSFPTE